MTDIDPGCVHCWHTTGLVENTDPQQYHRQCCYCDTEEDYIPDIGPHGNYIPPSGL